MSTLFRVTRSAVKKNPRLLDLDLGILNKKTPKKSTTTKTLKKKLDMSDKENTTPKASKRKRAPKRSTKKKVSPKKGTKKKSSTPKSSTKKTKTPKKTTPKSSTKKKTKPKSSTKEKTATPKNSKKKSTTPKKTTPKNSTKKINTPKSSTKKKSPARKSSEAKNTKSRRQSLSEKVAELSDKIGSDDVTAEDLSEMFEAPKKRSPKRKSPEPSFELEPEESPSPAPEEDYVMVDTDVQSEDMHANKAETTETTEMTEMTETAVTAEETRASPSTGASSDLTIMTACSLLAYVIAHYLPSFLEDKLKGQSFGPIENPIYLIAASICSVIFGIGFQFASSWSGTKDHATHVYRVSFGLATVLVGAYMYNCCEVKFQKALITASLGFAMFELLHLWQYESVGGYFRIAITAMIGFWSVNMLMPNIANDPSKSLFEYNTYILLVFTVGNILSATEAIPVHFAVGTYLVSALSIFIWALQNEKIPYSDFNQPIKMGVLTFAPTFLAILDQLK